MNVLALTLILSCLPAALIDFALPKWKADQSFRIEDAYKWTYQATRGGEHAIPDEASARKWMENEWRLLGEIKTNEPVWEPLCPGGEIGRLNMRPLKAKGGNADELLNAFLASSREYRSDGNNFLAAWNELGKRLKKHRSGKLDYGSWQRLDAEMAKKNYPAVHHSETYNKAHHPSYRILTPAEMKKLLKDRK